VLARDTPFELQGIRDSAKQLMAMGIEADNMIPTLKMLGDAAAGTGVPLQQIAYVYGQIKTAGVLNAQDANQLLNASIPIWEELGKVVGKTVTEVRAMSERREITFDDVEQAFENMTSSGGKFANLMEAQSESLTGKWNAFKDTLGGIWETIGTKLIPIAKVFVDLMTWMVSTTMGRVLLLIPVFTALFGVIGAVTARKISLTVATL